MNRRDLLKAFGVGATIAPVIEKTRSISFDDNETIIVPTAKILEPPKVEIVEEARLKAPASTHASFARGATLTLTPRNSGRHHRGGWRQVSYIFEVASVSMAEAQVNLVDVTTYDSRDRRYVATRPDPGTIEFRAQRCFREERIDE